jgi:bifunctional non-homologous end joining protein LigD
MERSPGKRRKKIYLDYMQNRRGQTLAAAYCVRPRPGAPVSAPLTWDEVKSGLTPSAFTIETMPARLAARGELWRELDESAIDLDSCMLQLSKLIARRPQPR